MATPPPPSLIIFIKRKCGFELLLSNMRETATQSLHAWIKPIMIHVHDPDIHLRLVSRIDVVSIDNQLLSNIKWNS